jgi:Uma2 family endonuclease
MVIKVRDGPKIRRTSHLPIQQPVRQREEDDPYYYGYRIEERVGPDGEVAYDWIPLTQADFLNPQLGDKMVQSSPHIQLVISLYNRFDDRYRHRPDVGVFSDLKMLWGIPGLTEPAPDLAIVFDLKAKDKPRSSFEVVKEGVLPSLVVEVMSAKYPGDDTVKVRVYEQVGIQEYILINPHFETGGEFDLIGYRLVNGRYRPIKPDAQGRLLSETTGVWFALDETKRALILTDALTGERLLTEEEEYEALMAAKAQAEAETQRAEAETQRAEAEAQRAEAEAQRAEAEAQRAEAEARRAEAERLRAETAEAEVARLRALLAQRNGSA